MSLQRAFGSAIDFQNKYAFYGRLADATDRYLASTDPQSAKGLLMEVLAEATQMADEVK